MVVNQDHLLPDPRPPGFPLPVSQHHGTHRLVLDGIAEDGFKRTGLAASAHRLFGTWPNPGRLHLSLLLYEVVTSSRVHYPIVIRVPLRRRPMAGCRLQSFRKLPPGSGPTLRWEIHRAHPLMSSPLFDVRSHLLTALLTAYETSGLWPPDARS